MSVVFIKVISIAVRTLARPLVSYVTYYNRMKLQESDHKITRFIKNKLTSLGQNYNYYNILLNRRIFGLAKEQVIKPLTEDKALERGAEFISEAIVYTILLTIPTLEMLRSLKNSKIKEQKKKDFLIQIQKNNESLIELYDKNLFIINEIKDKADYINSNLKLV